MMKLMLLNEYRNSKSSQTLNEYIYGYYSMNPVVKGTFDFLKLVVDNWFKTV